MKRRWWPHLAFWLAYWLIYAYTYSRYDGQFWKYAWTEGVEMPARILATYASFWLLDRFVRPQTTWIAFTGVAAANVLGGLANRLIKLHYTVPEFFPDATIVYWDWRAMVDIFDCVLASGVALTARLFYKQQDLLRREETLRREKIAAELQALKNQLQPHFLFNTINNLYALARMRSEKTAPVALQLANLLRFVLFETRRDTIPLEQEVRILRDYLALEQLRFDDERLDVRARFELDDPDQPITPLLLLPLVENAFKHGVSEQSRDAWVRLGVTLRAGRLKVEVENSARQARHETESRASENSARQARHETESRASESRASGGIGLTNLRRQLELAYPGRHKLEILQGENRFSVALEIDLTGMEGGGRREITLKTSADLEVGVTNP
jgi:hypothetical protein